MPQAPIELDPKKHSDYVQIIEDESRARGFVEYPKHLHRTDGTHVVVTSKREEEDALRSGDVHPTPAEALEEKAAKDKAEAARNAEKIGKEAAAAGKAPVR